ncbi:MAG: glycerophosphodiester phosphodiesterase, partial [Promethearchaeota archaeon]
MNSNNKIIIMGHRGASKIAPENTLKAFKEAIRLKADAVEFDAQETVEGEIVIIHDYDTLRTAGTEGIVKQMTLKELKKLNFGNGEQIPTLLELIQLAKGKISLNCEIKVEGIAKKIIHIFQDADILDSTIVSSFLHEELSKIQKIEPQLKLATLVPTEAGKFSDWNYKKKLIDLTSENNYYAINPLYKLADKQFIEYAHEKNIKVFPWTVDSGIAMKKLINMGTDGIITNDISRL